MNKVTLTMTAELIGEKESRSIDITNAMSNGAESWELRGESDQRANLERWITERGNEQHDTILALESWLIS